MCIRDCLEHEGWQTQEKQWRLTLGPREMLALEMYNHGPIESLLLEEIH